MQRHPAQPRDYAAVSVSTPPAARSRQLRRRPVDQFWRAEAGQFSVAVKGKLLDSVRKAAPADYFDPGMGNVANLINQSRIPAVHAKQDIPVPSSDQAVMVAAAVFDVIQRVVVAQHK